VAARPLRRVAGTTLWQQLRKDVLRRLDDGEFADVFPGEQQLREEYGVSRQTVREALRALREDGIVTAARGRQPRVGGQEEIAQPLGALYSLFDSVEAQHLHQHSIVLRLHETQDAHAAVRLGLEESTPLIYLERLRLAQEIPLAIDRTWLPAQIARPLLAADFSHTSLYNELANRCAIRLTGGQEDIRAHIPTAAHRRLLELGEDTAVLRVERIGRVGTVAVEWRITTIRADRFSLHAKFSARTGYVTQIMQ
jgi:GntR family transcriptional regulator